VRERFRDLPAPPPLESPEAARFRLFDSIAAFLKSAAQVRPMVLILDDLQWADSPSLLLLQFVAGDLAASRLLVVGCYRDVELSRQHPLAQALGELNRQRAFGRVLLRGLTQADVARFIELTSGIQPPEGLVRAVYQQTEGNPFFVNEIVRLLVQEGELSPEKLKERKSWSVRIPEGVREVIGRRLNRLSERCNEVLTIAAVIGREFTLPQIGRLVEDLSEDRLLDVLEEGLAARAIEELPRALGRYQFTHALTQETLAGELSLTRKVRLHARIAQALEALYGADAVAHAAELAYHYGEAEAVLGPEKLVRYSLLAGEKALATYAWEEAAAHLQRGLAAREGKPVDDDAAALHYGLGRAQAALMQVAAAAGHLKGAFDYYDQRGDVQRCATVASVVISNQYGRQLMAPLVERALRMVPAESLEAGWLLCAQARYLGSNMGDFAGGKQLCPRAIAVARRGNNLSLELHALTIWAQLAFLSDLQECQEVLSRALPLLDAVDSPMDASTLHFVASVLCMIGGDTQQAKVHAAERLAVAERWRDRERLSISYWNSSRIAMLEGNWVAARAFADRALGALPHDPPALMTRMLLECELGHTEQAEAYTRRLLEAERLPEARGNYSLHGIPLAARIIGDTRALAGLKARAATADFDLALWGGSVTMALGLVAAIEGDAVSAAERYAALETIL
ncbi:MAG: AAA family ATPase, partial [Chloroflexota bacterium]